MELLNPTSQGYWGTSGKLIECSFTMIVDTRYPKFQIRSLVLGAANWMRTSIPEFAKETFPLQKLLKGAQVTMQSAKASKAARFKFTFDIWKHEINSALKSVKAAIRDSIQLGDPPNSSSEGEPRASSAGAGSSSTSSTQGKL